jgi:hypothetical protein
LILKPEPFKIVPSKKFRPILKMVSIDYVTLERASSQLYASIQVLGRILARNDPQDGEAEVQDVPNPPGGHDYGHGPEVAQVRQY